MIIAILIKKDDELLMLKELCDDGKEYWSLPSYAIESMDDLDNISDQIYNDFGIQVALADLYNSYEIESKQYLFVNSELISYIYSPKGNAEWVNARELGAYLFTKENDATFKKLIIEYKQQFSIGDIIRETVKKVCSDTGLNEAPNNKGPRLEIRQSCDSIKVFVPNEFGNYCPYVFRVDFAIKSESTIDLFMSWGITRIPANGDKSDLYVLFSNVMSILLKCYFKQSVLVDYLSFMSPVEFNSATIVFSNENNEVETRELKQKIEYLFSMYLTSMYIFENVIGSLSLIRTDKKCDDLYSKYFDVDDYFNYMIGEEHEYYANFNKGIFLIRIKNGFYDKTRLLSEHKWEFVDGIDGKILYQIDMSKESYNYVSNEDWGLISDLIKKMNINDYDLVCQENHIYILQDNNIWMINSDFSEYWANEEKEKILDRQAHENAILNFNRKFQWRFPVDSGRFEELIADIMETDVFVQDVRLVGKSNNADGGRDLLIYKRYQQDAGIFITGLVIGQCKAYKKTVNKSQVQDIRDTVEHYNGQGFFLAVTSAVSAPLIDHLCKLKEIWDTDWWTEREIFKKLRHHPRIANMYTDILE